MHKSLEAAAKLYLVLLLVTPVDRRRHATSLRSPATRTQMSLPAASLSPYDSVQDKLLPLPPCEDVAQLPLQMASALVLSGTCCPMSLFTPDGYVVYPNQAAVEYMVRLWGFPLSIAFAAAMTTAAAAAAEHCNWMSSTCTYLGLCVRVIACAFRGLIGMMFYCMGLPWFALPDRGALSMPS